LIGLVFNDIEIGSAMIAKSLSIKCDLRIRGVHHTSYTLPIGGGIHKQSNVAINFLVATKIIHEIGNKEKG
jgi:hypothetical protein